MSQFKDLIQSAFLLENLKKLGISEPTKIQAKVIPLVQNGRDVIGIAQTGTGKTFAFLLPLISLKKVTLILVPTRELAIQIGEAIQSLISGTELTFATLYGGVDQVEQVASLKLKPQFIVATPGRLLDLIDQKQVPLKQIETLILDEADQMLSLGFIENIESIISFLVSRKQTLLFSATMPSQVSSLAAKVMKNPEQVEATANSSTVTKIIQKVYFCRKDDKFQLLRKILKEERQLVVIFTKTKETADTVKEYLRNHRLASIVLHGDKSQNERERAMSLFRDGSMKILIATDIAARGIDVKGISHVINFELPLDPENYVHRIGRTGRAGRDGIAVTLCEEGEKPLLDKIESLIKLKIPSENYKGTPEPKVNLKAMSVPKIPQDRKGFIDHSKRQGEKDVARSHPGFKHKKRR